MNELSTLDFFDPRGRVNRKGLIIFAAVLIGAQAGVYSAFWMYGVDFGSGLASIFNGLFGWLGLVAVSKRLHDLNLSAWRLVAAVAGCLAWCFVFSLAVVFVLGEEAFTGSEMGMTVAIIGALAPLAMLTLWLHCAKGDGADNRFGPRPGAFGFSRDWRGEHWIAPAGKPAVLA